MSFILCNESVFWDKNISWEGRWTALVSGHMLDYLAIDNAVHGMTGTGTNKSQYWLRGANEHVEIAENEKA